MKKSTGIGLFMALGLIAATVLTGCKGGTVTTTTKATQTTSAAPTTSAKTGATEPYGELRMATSTFGGQVLDPVPAPTGMIATLLAPMFDWLFTVDAQGKLIARLVEKWEIAPDGLSWTYAIRKGVKFHNGDDVTAADVKFSLDRYNTPAANTGDVRNMVDHVDVVDNNTVRVFTKGKQPYLPYASWTVSSMLGAAMPKSYIEKNTLEAFTKKPVGSGPFKFVSTIPGDSIEYEANAAYWDKAPAFKKVTTVLVPDENTRTAMLKIGQVDLIDVGVDKSLEMRTAGFRTPAVDSAFPNIMFIGAYNPKAANLPTGDIRVRQALSMAIDRGEIMKTFFRGVATPPPPTTVSDASSDIDLPFWMDYAAKAYRYDLEGAKKLMSEAGYAQGFNINMYSFTMTGAPYLPDLANIFQAYWAKLGVKVSIIPQEFASFMANGISKDAPYAGQSSVFRSPGGRPVTPRELQNAWHSTKGSGWGLLGGNKEFETAVEGAMTETDPAKRRDLIAKAMKMTVDSYTLLNICGVPSLVAIGPAVDLGPTPRGYGVGQLAYQAKHK